MGLILISASTYAKFKSHTYRIKFWLLGMGHFCKLNPCLKGIVSCISVGVFSKVTLGWCTEEPRRLRNTQVIHWAGSILGEVARQLSCAITAWQYVWKAIHISLQSGDVLYDIQNYRFRFFFFFTKQHICMMANRYEKIWFVWILSTFLIDYRQGVSILRYFGRNLLIKNSYF